MHLYIEIFGKIIPMYGLMITLGIITANIIAFFVIRKYGMDLDYFFVLEAYAFLGGGIGAKLLYLIVSYREIEWNRITEPGYFNNLMRAGFVFYGGLIVGIILVILAGRIHHIDVWMYIRRMVFLVPWIHGFGRIGCFMAGCCYGVMYDGPFAVTFPEGSIAPSGIKMFPVQMTEAICLFIISVVILILIIKKDTRWSLEVYFISYGIVRFVLEFFRADELRGKYLCFSTSQWISILIVAGTVIYIMTKMRESGSVKR